VRVILYILAPFAVFFISFVGFARWWTALIEIGAIGVLAWRAAEHYDKHHRERKYDDHGHGSENIERYARTYGRGKEEDV
jgi:hypothetical protein